MKMKSKIVAEGMVRILANKEKSYIPKQQKGIL